MHRIEHERSAYLKYVPHYPQHAPQWVILGKCGASHLRAHTMVLCVKALSWVSTCWVAKRFLLRLVTPKPRLSSISVSIPPPR